MENLQKRFIYLVLAFGLLLLTFGVLTRHAYAQNPTGNNDWPLWTRHGQGSTVLYGAVTCAAGGTDFLTTRSAYRTSIVIVNTHASVSLAFCPKGSTDVSGSACAYANGLLLKAGAAVTLDQSVLASGTAGFTCFGNSTNSTLRFWVEQ